MIVAIYTKSLKNQWGNEDVPEMSSGEDAAEASKILEIHQKGSPAEKERVRSPVRRMGKRRTKCLKKRKKKKGKGEGEFVECYK